VAKGVNLDLRVEIVDVRVCLKSVAVMFNYFQRIAPTNVPCLTPHWSVCGKREVDVVYFALPPLVKDSTGWNAHFGISELCSYYFADQWKMFNCWFFPFF